MKNRELKTSFQWMQFEMRQMSIRALVMEGNPNFEMEEPKQTRD